MRRYLVTGVVALALLVTLVPSVAATTTWTARLGYYGVATIRIGSSDRLSINVKHFRPQVAYPISLRRGSCARLGTLVWSTRLTSSSTGTMVRTLYLTRAQTSAAKLPLSIRIGTKCAIFTAPAPTPTPSSTPQPSASPSSSPSPSPSATTPGGTLIVGPGYMLTLPDEWVYRPDLMPSATRMVFTDPRGRLLLADTIVTGLTLEELVASISESTPAMLQEHVENVTIGDVPGRLFAYHFNSSAGGARYEIDSFAVSNGRAYELSFSNVAGTEEADLAFFRTVLGTFRFLGAGF